MIEETRMKKFIQNGVIKYARVELTVEDIIANRDKEIKNLKSLIDELRRLLEKHEQRLREQQPIEDTAIAEISTYECYK
jgi:hypothetical protein